MGSAGASKAEIKELDVVQTLSYLRASAFEIALLLYFGGKHLGVKRVILFRGGKRRLADWR